MFYKPRTKPTDLIFLNALNNRMDFNSEERRHYLNLKKGYEGELLFDSLTEKLQCQCLILNDLLLEINNTTFQIDTLIIVQGKILLYEVKNYEGDYYYESDKLYKKPKFEVINPLHQLSRSESLLRQLLLNNGYNLPIEASIVFINPKFTLYQAPLDKPIIFPTQIKNYLSRLNITPSKLTKKQQELANQLLALHITDSPYKYIPVFDYAQLRKGIYCPKCYSYSTIIGRKKFTCKICQYEELLDESALRTIEEFKTLFPNVKITTNAIHDWCQVLPKIRIRKILLHNFTKIGNHRWSYYE